MPTSTSSSMLHRSHCTVALITLLLCICCWPPFSWLSACVMQAWLSYARCFFRKGRLSYSTAQMRWTLGIFISLRPTGAPVFLVSRSGYCCRPAVRGTNPRHCLSGPLQNFTQKKQSMAFSADFYSNSKPAPVVKVSLQ
jgi:hypothetical protein